MADSPVPLITGGSSDIGAAATRRLLSLGHRVAVTGRGRPDRFAAAGDGVVVTLINPGRVATPFWDRHGGRPDGAILSADAVASTIAWAISQPSGVDVNTLTVRPVGASF
jgi:NADP-dependent 3-hydroxy acid dehydrogenase YdfG